MAYDGYEAGARSRPSSAKNYARTGRRSATGCPWSCSRSPPQGARQRSRCRSSLGNREWRRDPYHFSVRVHGGITVNGDVIERNGPGTAAFGPVGGDDLILNRLEQIDGALRRSLRFGLHEGAGDISNPRRGRPDFKRNASPRGRNQQSQNLIVIEQRASWISHHIDDQAIGVLLEEIDLFAESSQRCCCIGGREVGNADEADLESRRGSRCAWGGHH